MRKICSENRDHYNRRLRALHFDFERGDQRIFGVNDEADRKLHLRSPACRR